MDPAQPYDELLPTLLEICEYSSRTPSDHAVAEPVTGSPDRLRLRSRAVDVSLLDRLRIHKHVLLFVLGGTRG